MLDSKQLLAIDGSRIFPLGHFPPGLPPEKYANNVVEIEAGLMKLYLFSRSWIDETILS